MAREMKDSGVEWIGEIPKKWNISRFKYICGINNEFVDPKSGLYDELPHIGPGNIEKFSGRLLNYKLVKDEGLISGKYHFFPHEIIYGKINPQLGKVAFPKFEGLCSADAYAIHANVNLINIQYLFYFMLNKGFIDATILESLRMGMPKINSDDLMKLSITIPQMNEQKRIVSFLDTECARIDSVIDQTRKSIEEYKKLKQAVITHAVTKGIRPNRQMKDSGIPLIGDIPTEWTVQRIKNMAEIYGRIGFRGYTTDDLVEEGEGAITLSPSNLRELKMVYDKCSYISWAKYEESPEIQIENGDILFVKTGSSYGKSSLVNDLPLQATINPQLVVFKNITIDNRFFLYALQTPSMRNEIEGIVSGGTIPTMGQEKMKSFHLCVPEKEEQTEIADYLDLRCSELDKLIGLKEQIINELEEMRKSTIFEYVTGKKEVPA